MKALEMEDDEVERFLDEADGTLPTRRVTTTATTLSRSGDPRSKTLSLLSSVFPSSSVSKLVAALLVIVTVVLLTFSAESNVPDEAEGNPRPPAGPPPTPTPKQSPLPVKPPPTTPSQTHPTAPAPVEKPPVPAPVPAPVPPPVPAPVPVPADDKNPSGGGNSAPNGFGYSKLSYFPPDVEASPVDPDTKAAQIEKWGKWKFFDGEEENRPTGDYCLRYPNRDVPGDDFPETAWQADAVFVNHLIDAAEQLVGRAKESIFTEYGHGKPLPPEKLVERTRGFKWTQVDLSQADVTEPPEAFRKGGSRGNGGWTTKTSQQGLARRLLHAIMTNDVFTVVVAGDASAAGHGGHFHQAYAAQFHRILRPILARLGVKLVTRNMSTGSGLGTIQSALGFRDLYGDDIDLVIWDSSSTEDTEENARENLDLFLRQAFLSGKSKIPHVWVGTNDAFDVLRELHNAAGVAVGEFGAGTDGITLTESADQVKDMPFAAQYVKCSESASNVCADADRFCAHCWIPRDDVDPKKAFTVDMADKPRNEATGNMGWREHLLTSRVLIMTILDELQTAIQTFSEGTMGGPPLEDDYWHVTDFYGKMRSKLESLDPEFGACANLKTRNLPSRICRTVMKGRGLHTPRFNPNESSLLTIVRAAPDGYKPSNTETMAYEGPDVHNSCFDIPDGEVDVLSLVSNRRQLEAAATPAAEVYSRVVPTSLQEHQGTTRNLADAIVPGKGWEVIWEKPGTCDGQYDSTCGRQRNDPCPLQGYHDSQGTLVGNENSGWLVFDLPDVKEGIILLRMITGLNATDNPRTDGWSSVNNERRAESLRIGRHYDTFRELQDDQIPDDLVFEWAINGEVTSWDKKTLLEKRSRPQKMVELWTLLDDSNFANKGKVELAIRLRGCGNKCTVGVPHVYWA